MVAMVGYMMNEMIVDDMFSLPAFRNVQKMPALFVIDRKKHLATSEVNENAAWVFDEPSKVTIKHDGTSITVTEDGKIYARRMVKKGKNAPKGFILAEFDPRTGHSFGLIPVEDSGFFKFFEEANGFDGPLDVGTYELVGPKINGNPERRDRHTLIPHGIEETIELPDMRNVSKEEAYDILEPIFADFKERGIEGVVWWGADSKRAKLRVNDFFGDPNRW